jgi:hypothetical protein
MRSVIFYCRFGDTRLVLVGLSRARACEDDLNLRILDDQMLYCIRPKDEYTFELVSECSVHGMIAGEALQFLGAENGRGGLAF